MARRTAGAGGASSSDDAAGQPGAASDAAHPSVDALRAEIEDLQRDNARLSELLNAKPEGSLTICGYLYKFRYYATGLSQSSWKKRFFTLHGSVLSYYLTENDTSQHPRGIMNLQGCVVEREPLKKGRYHTFGVVSPSAGLELIRISTESKPDADRWIDALRSAGCEERQLTPGSRAREPLRAADVRWGSATPAESADSAVELRNRWTSTPDRPGRRLAAGPSGDVSDSAVSDVSALRVPLPSERAAERRMPMRWSTPLHRTSRASILSSERLFQSWSQSQNAGLFSLAMVLVVATNLRLLIENFLKYGFLLGKGVVVTGALRSVAPTNNPRLLACWPALLLLCFLILAWERFGAWKVMKDVKLLKAKANKDLNPSQAKRKRRELGHLFECLMGTVSTALICAVIALPWVAIIRTKAEPLPASALFFVAIILFLKLVSYATANYDFRKARRANDTLPGERGTPEANMDGVPLSDHIMYPENLTVGNGAYFLLAPTLVYQLTYPRSARFRSRWVLWNCVKLASGLTLMLFLVEQYVEPSIRNTKPSFDEGNWLRILERILKLAIPTLYVWLCIFYTLFHAWLNILAECLHFGDREFYKDWWNAVTIGDYWRLWNMPVHKWMLRTVYYPAISFGTGRCMAGIIVFLASAVFHELLVGVPLRMNQFPYWSFLGIMGQVPLMYITAWIYRKVRIETIGNLTFWFTFCIFGQPWALLKYYIAYVDANK